MINSQAHRRNHTDDRDDKLSFSTIFVINETLPLESPKSDWANNAHRCKALRGHAYAELKEVEAAAPENNRLPGKPARNLPDKVAVASMLGKR